MVHARSTVGRNKTRDSESETLGMFKLGMVNSPCCWGGPKWPRPLAPLEPSHTTRRKDKNDGRYDGVCLQLSTPPLRDQTSKHLVALRPGVRQMKPIRQAIPTHTLKKHLGNFFKFFFTVMFFARMCGSESLSLERFSAPALHMHITHHSRPIAAQARYPISDMQSS